MNYKLPFQVILGALLALTVTAALGAGTPLLMNYQGRLTDAGGQPLSGNYSIVFTIYDDPVLGNPGNVKWQETHPNVTVTDGLFDVLLGAGTPAVPITEGVFTSPDRWLGIKVGSDPEISPRTKMASAAYSFATNHWTFRITDGADTSLVTRGEWGIARDGNTLYGSADSTHVNLGVASITGTNGQNYKYCTVAGGANNTASYLYATVGGGLHNTAGDGDGATVAGGCYNKAYGYHSTVGGGFNDTASWHYANAPPSTSSPRLSACVACARCAARNGTRRSA